MLANNQTYFKQHVAEYEASYLRTDEEVLVRRYFVNTQGKLLVLGCGAGRTLRPLHEMGFAVTGVDFVPEMVAAAKLALALLPVAVEQMDAAQLGFADQSFDYVFFPFHGIDYVTPDIYAAVKEAARVLRPNGVFIFNSHNRFFLKKLHCLFSGPVAEYSGLLTYRTLGWWEKRKMRAYFKGVQVKQRISLLPWREANWKDRLYKLLPFLNKSTYFVCKNPLVAKKSV